MKQKKPIFLLFILLIISLIHGGSIALAQTDCPDFNSDGILNLDDFFLFRDAFNSKKGDSNYDEKFNLVNTQQSQDKIDFGDFLEFAKRFERGCESAQTKKEPFLIKDIINEEGMPGITHFPNNYVLGITPMYKSESGNYIPFGRYMNLKYIDWRAVASYPRPNTDMPFLIYVENLNPINSFARSIVTANTNKGPIDIYLPALALTKAHTQDFYYTPSKAEGLFLYVDKNGLTYYPRKDHSFGYPDMNVEEAIKNEHLASDDLSEYPAKKSLDLNKETAININNWMINFNVNSDNKLDVNFYVYDYPIGAVLSMGNNQVYSVRYAEQEFAFQLLNFDSSKKMLEYQISLSSFNECFCMETHECKNNRCELKQQNKKYGYLYVYESEATYNPEWRKNAEYQMKKFKEGIESITNGKIMVTADILGEYKTDELCWNPADATHFEYALNYLQDTILLGSLPGSSFKLLSTIYYDITINKLDCNKCNVETSGKNTIVSIKCDRSLMPKDHFDYLGSIKAKASAQLNFKISDYDDIFVVYGRFGRVDPNENDKNLMYACRSMVGIISAWSSLEFSENSLKFNGVTDCRKINYLMSYYADAPGWHTIIHEILHKFGADDVYDTGIVFGLVSSRDLALKIDSNADQSIMGNGKRICADKNNCKPEEIEFLYLDKYNKRAIGIWD